MSLYRTTLVLRTVALVLPAIKALTLSRAILSEWRYSMKFSLGPTYVPYQYLLKYSRLHLLLSSIRGTVWDTLFTLYSGKVELP